MLVLSRKIGEKIIIETPAGRVVVQVSQIVGGKSQSRRVKLGFEAPKSIPILRGELVRKEDRAA